jgi:hypothetical protein
MLQYNTALPYQLYADLGAQCITFALCFEHNIAKMNLKMLQMEVFIGAL